jgi:hypothetical protein
LTKNVVGKDDLPLLMGVIRPTRSPLPSFGELLNSGPTFDDEVCPRLLTRAWTLTLSSRLKPTWLEIREIS